MFCNNCKTPFDLVAIDTGKSKFCRSCGSVLYRNINGTIVFEAGSPATTNTFDLQKNTDANAERQRQEMILKQRQAEIEQQRQADAGRLKQEQLTRQREEELERQKQADAERLRQEQLIAQRNAEIEKQKQAELQRQQQIEAERKRQEEIEKQKQIEQQRKREEEERIKQAELEKQRLAALQRQQEIEAEKKRQEEADKKRVDELVKQHLLELEQQRKREEEERMKLAEAEKEAEIKQQQEAEKKRQEEEALKQQIAEEQRKQEEEENANPKKKSRRILYFAIPLLITGAAVLLTYLFYPEKIKALLPASSAKTDTLVADVQTLNSDVKLTEHFKNSLSGKDILSWQGIKPDEIKSVNIKSETETAGNSSYIIDVRLEDNGGTKADAELQLNYNGIVLADVITKKITYYNTAPVNAWFSFKPVPDCNIFINTGDKSIQLKSCENCSIKKLKTPVEQDYQLDMSPDTIFVTSEENQPAEVAFIYIPKN